MSDAKIYILTYSVNDYNQYGEYFKKVFFNEINTEDLKSEIEDGVSELELLELMKGNILTRCGTDYYLKCFEWENKTKLEEKGE